MKGSRNPPPKKKPTKKQQNNNNKKKRSNNISWGESDLTEIFSTDEQRMKISVYEEKRKFTYSTSDLEQNSKQGLKSSAYKQIFSVGERWWNKSKSFGKIDGVITSEGRGWSQFFGYRNGARWSSLELAEFRYSSSGRFNQNVFFIRKRHYFFFSFLQQVSGYSFQYFLCTRHYFLFLPGLLRMLDLILVQYEENEILQVFLPIFLFFMDT